ncbi:hypothetical protein AAH678_01610 [Sodalis endosymbiont of Spalangia cameroni]
MTSNDEFDRPFNFNLEEMRKAVESKGIEVPEWALMGVESFIKWLEGNG